MSHDPDAACAVVHALNEWMHEHWTYVYSDAIYSTPIVSLAAGNDNEFYATKLNTARFYMSRVLPQTTSLNHQIKAGAATLMALPAEAF